LDSIDGAFLSRWDCAMGVTATEGKNDE
jgi:hypothetical protein